MTDSTGDPIRNARVTLLPESQETPVVLTDAAGAFRLTALLGRFSIVASRRATPEPMRLRPFQASRWRCA